MKRLSQHPRVLEINARLWLSRLSVQEGRDVSLVTVPEATLRAIADRFDLLWLMGAWQRSPGSREQALTSSDIRRALDHALPGWTVGDVDGSPYAVHHYTLASVLGGLGDLRVFRDRLHDVGVRLVVDFVANHFALDHCWTIERPEFFVRGTEQLSRNHPGWFFRTAQGEWLAHGRDPNFPPWSDTAQVNVFCPAARAALRTQVMAIADVADGVRCDMAMLGLSGVFERVWGWALPVQREPRPELWGELIAAVKSTYRDFLFIAEAYWGLETRLLELGFDYAYDKALYDLTLNGTAGAIRAHLVNSAVLVPRAVRFIENHDERRAPVAFGRARSQAAAIAIMTLPGMRLVHDGQIEGKRIHHPVQIVREPAEPVDEPMVEFYNHLLEVTRAPAFQAGAWTLVDVEPAVIWDESDRDIVAWSWTHGTRHHIVALNQSSAPARGRLRPPLGIAWPAVGWTTLVESSPMRRPEGQPAGVDVHLGPWSALLAANDTQERDLW